MATKTFEDLKQMAIQIRDEKANKHNTATRIGTQMLEHLTKLEQDYYNKEIIDEQNKENDKKLSELENISSIYSPNNRIDGIFTTNGDIFLKDLYAHTNFIPINKNDVVHIKAHFVGNSYSYISIHDIKSFKFIGNLNDQINSSGDYDTNLNFNKFFEVYDVILISIGINKTDDTLDVKINGRSINFCDSKLSIENYINLTKSSKTRFLNSFLDDRFKNQGGFVNIDGDNKYKIITNEYWEYTDKISVTYGTEIIIRSEYDNQIAAPVLLFDTNNEITNPKINTTKGETKVIIDNHKTAYAIFNREIGKSLTAIINYGNGLDKYYLNYITDIKYTEGVWLSNGVENKLSGYKTSEYIPVLPNQEIDLVFKYNNTTLDRVTFYDSSKKYLSKLNTEDKNINLVVPENAYYLRLSAASDENTAYYNRTSVQKDIHFDNLIRGLDKKVNDSSFYNLIHDIQKGTYIDLSGGTSKAGASWDTTDFESVKPDTEINYSLYVTRSDITYIIAFYDNNKKFLPDGSLKGNLKEYYNGIINVPSNARYVRFTLSTVLNDNQNAIQSLKDRIGVSVETDKKKPIIALPKNIDVVTNHQYSIFTESIRPVNNDSEFVSFNMWYPTDEVMFRRNGVSFNFKSLSKVSYDLVLDTSIRNSELDKLSAKSSNIRIFEPKGGDGSKKQIILMGDSLMVKDLSDVVWDNLRRDGDYNIIPLGTRFNNTNEGRGGWSWKEYTEKEYYGLSVTELVTLYALHNSTSVSPSDDAFNESKPSTIDGKYLWSKIKIVYSDNNVEYSDAYMLGQSTNVSVDYYQSTSRENPQGGSWVSVLPKWDSGKCYFVRYKIDGLAQSHFLCPKSFYASGITNPFINPSTHLVDFKYYMRTYHSDKTDTIDMLLVSLGTNDVDQANWNTPDYDAIIARTKKFIDALLRDYPNCKVAIGLPGAGGLYHPGTLIFQKKINTLNNYYIETFDDGKYNPNVTCMAQGINIDRGQCYQYKEVLSIDRMEGKVTVCTNLAHPIKQGYQMWGDGFYNKIRAFLAGKL